MVRLIKIDHVDDILNAFMLFVQTAQIVLKYADAYLYRKTRLSVSKLIVLKALYTNGTMMPCQLADWTNTERHNITAITNRMEKDGLVTSKRNSSNKRLVDIKLTKKGRETLNKAMPVAQEVVNQAMLSITKGDAALIKEKLAILRQNAHHGLKDLAIRI
jgi:DNA-binding MarR family transcriptional regulator